MRIVSLLPATTEWVYLLGHGEALVGRSHECDYPPQVKKLPSYTHPKLASPTQDPLQAISLYEVDIAGLTTVKPDLILTQTQCDVCAVSLSQVQSLAQKYLPTTELYDYQLYYWKDFFQEAERLFTRLGHTAAGKKNLEKLQKTAAQWTQKAAQVSHKPQVGFIEWIEPLMGCGHWMPELIEAAGGLPLWGQKGARTKRLSPDKLIYYDPEVIIVSACGWDLERTYHAMLKAVRSPYWQTLTAYRSKNIFVTDGNSYFNRPGPRLVDSLIILYEILHTPRNPYNRYRGTGWECIFAL
ncbi:MAG: ABC transporter substrate-binding protein [Bacteroidia bacterium]